MSKTIYELPKIYTEVNKEDIIVPNLNEIYSGIDYGTKFGKFCSTSDYIPISHLMYGKDGGTGDETPIYVTYKLRLDEIDYWMYQLHRDAISAYLSSHLNLGNLAWKNKSELNLSALSRRHYVNYKDIVKYAIYDSDVNLSPSDKYWERSIPVECLDPNPGEFYQMTVAELSADRLGLKNLSRKDESELNLQALAHESIIRDNLVADDAKISHTKIDGFKALANRDYIDLGNSYRGANGGTIGNLSTAYIDGLEKYDLHAATSRNLGGLRIGYPNIGGKYGVKLNSGTDQAYVEVPWTDTKLIDLSADIFSKNVNEVELSVSYKMSRIQNGGQLVQLPEVTLQKKATIQPYIQNNVTSTATTGIQNRLAIFNTGSSSNVTISPINNAVIDTRSNEYSFLRKNGNFEVIPKATDKIDGLMSKEDKQTLSSLSRPEKVFYVLPEATNQTLGGVKVFAKIPKSNLAEYTNGEHVVSLPVYKDDDNKLFVNILSAVGESDTMDTKIDTRVETAMSDIFSKLYPKGSIYLTTEAECPISALIPGSNWEKIEGRYLLASGQIVGTGSASNERFSAGAAVPAGLPNHSHAISVGLGSCSCKSQTSIHNSHNSSSWYPSTGGPSYAKNVSIATSLTVRPPAYAVNVFRRTA